MKRFYLISLTLLYFCGNTFSQTKNYTLEECIAYGLENQPSLKSKNIIYQRSQEEQKNAVSRLLPQVSANASFDYYWAIPVQVFPAEVLGGEKGTYVPLRIGTPYNAGAGIEMQWDILKASSWQEIRTAAIRQQLAQVEKQSEKSLIIRNIIKAYYTVMLQKKQLDFDKQNFLNYDTLRTIAQLRFEKGTIQQMDVNRVKSSFIAAQNEWQKSQIAYTNSVLQLKLWMGMSPDTEISIEDKQIEVSTVYTPVFSMNSHPEYNLYKQKQELYTSELRAQKTDRLPSLLVYSSYYKRAYRTSADFFSGSSQTWFGTGLIGLKLQIPVFNGWQLQRNVNVARFTLRQAQTEEEAFQLRASVAFAEQSNALLKNAESLKLMQENLALAHENQQIATYKFTKGVSTADILKNVQREALEAQKIYLKTLSDYYMSRVELSYLNGEYTQH